MHLLYGLFTTGEVKMAGLSFSRVQAPRRIKMKKRARPISSLLD